MPFRDIEPDDFEPSAFSEVEAGSFEPITSMDEGGMDFVDLRRRYDASELSPAQMEVFDILDKRGSIPKPMTFNEGVAQTEENLQNPLAVGETAANLVTSAYGIPASGLAGGLGLALQSGAKALGISDKDPVEVANAIVQAVQKGLVYQPQTEAGQELTEAATYPFAKLEEAGAYVGSKIDDPALATAAHTAIVGGPALLMWKGRGAPTKPGVISKKIEAAVDKGISKGIRPPVSGKQTASQVGRYKRQAKTAVEEIVKSQDDIKLTDIGGEPVAGMPKTLGQFSQAIEQVRRNLFEEYDALAKRADGEGVSIDTSSIVRELTKIAEDKQVQTYNPKVAEYAKGFSERMSENQVHTAPEVQNAIAMMNDNLNSFYKNPSYEHASNAYVDSLVANNLRKLIDSEIEQATGGGYQALKNRYGAMKAIEKDVNHRAIVDARKNIKGLIDFTDVFTSSEVVHGIMSGNPALVGKGVTGKIIATIAKMKNDPNRIVKRMFSDVDKLMEKQRPKTIPVSKQYEGPTYEEPQ